MKTLNHESGSKWCRFSRMMEGQRERSSQTGLGFGMGVAFI